MSAPSTLILPLDAFVGSQVKDIGRDMIALAKQLNITVSMNVNGAHILAFPNSKLVDLQRDYERQLEAQEPK